MPTPMPTPTPTPTPTPDPTPGVPTVIVDGKETTAGEVTTEGGKTTVAVNQDVIKSEIDNATDNVTVVVPGGTGTAEAQLVVQNIDDMASKDMTLTVQVGDVSYDLPTAAVDTQSILDALGADNPADVPITITITTNMTDEAQAEIDRIVSENGASVVFPPIEFSITATYNGQTVDITEFNQYVSRTVEVTEEQAKQITTAIVVDADGTVRHVPTTVTYDEQTGKWYATINSLTNSTYALVYNEVTFADAQGKWYESAVNEMGSRMIISGVADGLFAGERDITRAEFAVIIIQALGLPKNGDGTVFTDVPATAWYAGAVGKAYEYGIVAGIGGGRFAPDTKITRQEAMQMLYNAAQITGFEGSTGSIGAFPDAADISAWALDAVRWNVGSGLVVGADGQLQPLRNITRAETAALVLKLLQKAGLIDVRTPLTTAQTTNAAAFMMTDPRKEPDPVIVPDDNDEETHDSDDGGTNADAQAN